jgi:hypothetical protein
MEGIIVESIFIKQLKGFSVSGRMWLALTLGAAILGMMIAPGVYGSVGIVANSPPEITEGDTVTVDMDEDGFPRAFALTLHAADPDIYDTLTWSVAVDAQNGAAGVTAGTGDSQEISYTPDPDYSGTDAFVIQVSDGELADTITVTINVHEEKIVILNNPPEISEGDAITVNMSEDGVPAPFALTLHAADPEEDLLTWSLLAAPANGAAVAGGTGNSIGVNYTPTANYSGTDSFVVQVSDGKLTDTITVNVSIAAQNDPPVIAEGEAVTVTMDEDGNPIPFRLTLNAGDPDGDPLTWSIATAAGNGIATAGGTGNSIGIGYTPNANYNGADNFVVQVSDGKGGTDRLTVSVNIGFQNDAPVIAEGDAVAVSMDEDGFPAAFALTLNAADSDGDMLTWTILTPAANGTASAAGTGDSVAVDYTPNLNYSGTDSFAVQVSDGKGGTDTITVTVSIGVQNDPPEIAEGDAITVEMDEDGNPRPFSLTLNANDPDGDILTWQILTAAENGTATVTGEGYTKAVSYIPNAGYSGEDFFTAEVSDGNGGTDTIVITVNIVPQNDPPEIVEGEAVTVEMDEDGNPRPFSLTLNATDPDGDILTWSIITAAENGTATVSGEGYTKAISYVPNAGYSGSDAFWAQVSDGELTDAVLVIVNIIPATDDDCAALCKQDGGKCAAVSMDEDGDPQPFDLKLTASDPNNDILTWSIISPAEFGTASADGTGYTKEIGYVPNPDFNGTDSFVIQVSDGELTDSLRVYVCIAPQKDAPVIAEGESVTVEMDEDGYPAGFNLTLNASDGDGDSLTWRIASPAGNGSANVSGTGNSKAVSYIPNAGYNGTDSFVVEVSDGELTDAITVNVNITPNVAGDCDVVCQESGGHCRAVYMDEDSFPRAFELTLNASDPDEDILTWSIITPAEHGTAHASGTGYTKAIAYTPDPDYNGMDRFEVQVSDGWLTDSLFVYVCISPQDEEPGGFIKTDPSETADGDAASSGEADIRLEPDAGDMSAGEGLDLGDAILGLQILSGIATSQPLPVADVNNDGKTGMEEVIYVLKALSDMK